MDPSLLCHRAGFLAWRYTADQEPHTVISLKGTSQDAIAAQGHVGGWTAMTDFMSESLVVAAVLKSRPAYHIILSALLQRFAAEMQNIAVRVDLRSWRKKFRPVRIAQKQQQLTTSRRNTQSRQQTLPRAGAAKSLPKR